MTVEVNPTLNQITVVQPEAKPVVVRDSIIRGATGPQGPQGPLATTNTQNTEIVFDVDGIPDGSPNLTFNLATNTFTTHEGVFTGNVKIEQNLNVTGDISMNGNLIIGNMNTDTIQVVSDFTSNLVPDVPDTFNLGQQGKRWNELHVNEAKIQSVNLAGNLTATQNTTITVGATTVNTSFISANVLISGPTETTYNVFTTNADTPITIDSFSSASFTTVKYIIQSKSIDGYHSTEMFCMQDGISAYITEYATLFNNYTLGTYSLVIDGPTCNLVFTPYNPENNIITVKLVRTAITA